MSKAIYLFSAIFSFSMIAILYTIHNIGAANHLVFANSDKLLLFIMIFTLAIIVSLYKFFTTKDM